MSSSTPASVTQAQLKLRGQGLVFKSRHDTPEYRRRKLLAGHHKYCKRGYIDLIFGICPYHTESGATVGISLARLPGILRVELEDDEEQRSLRDTTVERGYT